jgi:hypothetical protein
MNFLVKAFTKNIIIIIIIIIIILIINVKWPIIKPARNK